MGSHERIHAGTLPAFRLTPKTYRLPAELLVRNVVEAAHHVTLDDVMLVLCLGRTSARLLIKDNKIPRAKAIGAASRSINIARHHLVALLEERKLLPSHLDALTWWASRLRYRSAVYSALQVSSRWHMNPKNVRATLDGLKLPYIFTPGRNLVVPEESVVAVKKIRLALTARQLAAILGVDEAQADAWAAAYTLCSESHGGRKRDLCPSRTCMETYITNHRTHDSIAAADWLKTALDDGVPAIRMSIAHHNTAMLEQSHILALREEGILNGVYLPPLDGIPYTDIALSVASVRAMGMRDRQREAKLFRSSHRLDEYLG